jgi:MFS family permease
MFAGPIAGILVDKLSHRLTNIVGMILALVASICFALFGADSGYLMMIASFVFFGVGMALFMTANTGLVMSHAPNGQEGAVSGMMAEGTFVGAAVGVCAFETLYSFGKNSVAINSDSATQSIASALNGHHVASILGVAAIFCALLLTLFTRSKRFAGER